jgi:hypothetical protein
MTKSLLALPLAVPTKDGTDGGYALGVVAAGGTSF